LVLSNRPHDDRPTGPPAHLGLGGSCDVAEMYGTSRYRLIPLKKQLNVVCLGVFSREKRGRT
jgi:hypothetical protein